MSRTRLDELKEQYPGLVGEIAAGTVRHCDKCGTIWAPSEINHRCIGIVEGELKAAETRAYHWESTYNATAEKYNKLLGTSKNNIDLTDYIRESYRQEFEEDKLSNAADLIRHAFVTLAERSVLIRRLKNEVKRLNDESLAIIAERDKALSDLAGMTRRADELGDERDRAISECGALKKRAEAAEAESETFRSIKKMHAENGRFDISLDMAQSIICGMVSAMRTLLKGAENYMECDVSDRASGERYTVRVQRSDGKTPHQLREIAEAERDRFRHILMSICHELEIGRCEDGPCDDAEKYIMYIRGLRNTDLARDVAKERDEARAEAKAATERAERAEEVLRTARANLPDRLRSIEPLELACAMLAEKSAADEIEKWKGLATSEAKRSEYLIGKDGRNYCTKIERERDGALADVSELTGIITGILNTMDAEWPNQKLWREKSPEAGAFRAAMAFLAKRASNAT